MSPVSPTEKRKVFPLLWSSKDAAEKRKNISYFFLKNAPNSVIFLAGFALGEVEMGKTLLDWAPFFSLNL